MKQKTYSWTLETLGNPTSKREIVALHGWLGKPQDWNEVLTGSLLRYKWIIPTLPGHEQARTYSSPEHPFSFAELSASLLEQIHTQHGIQQRTWLGYSMGGRLALHAACTFPQWFEALFLESCQPGIVDSTARTQRYTLDQKRALSIRNEGLEHFVQHWYQAPLFASLHQHPKRYQQMFKQRIQHNADAVADTLQMLSPGYQTDVWEQLSTLKMPVGLLGGQEDHKYTQLLSQMHKLIPDSQCTLLPDVGHNVHFESPSQWQQIVLAFLERLDIQKVSTSLSHSPSVE